MIKSKNSVVIPHVFHITNYRILEICQQKSNSISINIIVKVLKSKLPSRRLKLDIHLVLKSQSLSISDLSLST